MGSKKWKLLDQNLKKRGADTEVYINGVLFEPKRVKRELGRQAFQTTMQKEMEKVISSKFSWTASGSGLAVI